MTFTAVSTLIDTATTTLAVNPSRLGNFYLAEVIANSGTIYCNAITGGNCTWTLLTSYKGHNNATYASVFLGKTTTVGSANATLGFSGVTPTFEAVAQQFSSSVGSYALYASGTLDLTTGTNTWPSLTPDGSGDLYFGFFYDSGTVTNGSTPGFTYGNYDGDGVAYNTGCGSGAQAPVWGDSGHYFGIAVLMTETPGTSQPSAIRARFPQFPALRGRSDSSPGAPVRNPAISGPVFRQKPYPVQAQDPLPRRGRIISNKGAIVSNPTTGPVFRQKTFPVRTKLKLPSRGRIASSKGSPVKNPTPGPVFRQAAHPAQAKLPKQPFRKGRIQSCPGANPNVQMLCGAMPGYVYPSYLGSYWNQFLVSTGKLPNIVILNNDNGDAAWNSDYEGLCTSLHALGITVLGYTYTNYGTRSAATVEAAVGNYLGAGITPGGNGVDGIFLDEFQSASGGFAYYSGICTSIQSQFLAGGGSAHPPIWGNPGTYLDSGYLALPVSTFVTFESDVVTYQRNTPYNVSVSGIPSSGQGSYARSRFAHLVYGVARDQVDGVVDRAYAGYAGYVYTTNTGGQSNPYYTIPGNDYLNDLVSRTLTEPLLAVTGIPAFIYPQLSPARIRLSLPKRGRVYKNAGSPVYPYPVPVPGISPGFWATPGIMRPGEIWAGNPYSYQLWQFTGHYPVYYLDYLDAISQDTLYAQPGGTYLIQVANTRVGLLVPPDDGRWLGETPEQDEVPLHRKMFLKLRQHIHKSRRRSGYRNPPGGAR